MQDSKWLTTTIAKYPTLDVKLIKEAYSFAENFPETPIPYAESTFSLGLTMAGILLELNTDSELIAAAIAYPKVYYNKIPPELVTEQLNYVIYKLISGVERMEIIHDVTQSPNHHTPSKQVENLA